MIICLYKEVSNQNFYGAIYDSINKRVLVGTLDGENLLGDVTYVEVSEEEYDRALEKQKGFPVIDCIELKGKAVKGVGICLNDRKRAIEDDYNSQMRSYRELIKQNSKFGYPTKEAKRYMEIIKELEMSMLKEIIELF